MFPARRSRASDWVEFIEEPGSDKRQRWNHSDLPRPVAPYAEELALMRWIPWSLPRLARSCHTWEPVRAGQAVKAVVNAILASLLAGEAVRVSGLGIFDVAARPGSPPTSRGCRHRTVCC